MKSFNKRARIGCCAGCSVILAAFALLALLVILPPPRPRPLSPTERAAAQRNAASIKTQITTLAADAKEGKQRDFDITIGESEINELLTSDAEVQKALQTLEVADPFVVIENSRIRVTVTRAAVGVYVASTLTLRPYLNAEQKIAIEVESAQLGRLHVPDTLTRRLANRMAREVTEKVNGQRVRMKSLQVEPGKILISGSIR